MFRLVLIALASLVACTDFEPASDELPALDLDIASQQPVRGNDFDCLGAPVTNQLVSGPLGAQRLGLTLPVKDLVTGLVPPDTVVRACARRDLDCMEPLTEDLTLDAEGWVTLPLYDGFDGYLEIEAPTLVPTILVYATPLSVDAPNDTTEFGVVTSRVLPGLSDAAGQPQRADMGLVHLRVFDCQGVPSPGVEYTIDQADAWRWYFVGEYPTSQASVTTDTGLGGFINVRPGVALVSAELAGQPPTLDGFSVYVRPGWMTGVRFLARAASLR